MDESSWGGVYDDPNTQFSVPPGTDANSVVEADFYGFETESVIPGSQMYTGQYVDTADLNTAQHFCENRYSDIENSHVYVDPSNGARHPQYTQHMPTQQTARQLVGNTNGHRHSNQQTQTQQRPVPQQQHTNRGTAPPALPISPHLASGNRSLHQSSISADIVEVEVTKCLAQLNHCLGLVRTYSQAVPVSPNSARQPEGLLLAHRHILSWVNTFTTEVRQMGSTNGMPGGSGAGSIGGGPSSSNGGSGQNSGGGGNWNGGNMQGYVQPEIYQDKRYMTPHGGNPANVAPKGQQYANYPAFGEGAYRLAGAPSPYDPAGLGEQEYEMGAESGETVVASQPVAPHLLAGANKAKISSPQLSMSHAHQQMYAVPQGLVVLPSPGGPAYYSSPPDGGDDPASTSSRSKRSRGAPSSDDDYEENAEDSSDEDDEEYGLTASGNRRRDVPDPATQPSSESVVEVVAASNSRRRTGQARVRRFSKGGAAITQFRVNPVKSTPHHLTQSTLPRAPNNKVPSSLANTGASTMMYSFNLRGDKKRPSKRRKQSLIASSAPIDPVRVDEFEQLAILGTGTFGKVRLVVHKATRHYYCLKMLRRQVIFRYHQVAHVQNEKITLSALNHPGIIKLFATFNDPELLYLLLEYVPGGELFTYIRRDHKFPESTARFYTAQLILALEYMHAKGIVYRDLKPENILLDSHGHVKLTDFGFAKHVVDRTWTMCGTPDYMAPEVIALTGHSTAVDYWSLGVLVYEMLVGYPPFTDEDTMTTFAKIREPEKIVYPEGLSPESVHFIRSLLVVDPSRRLGNIHRETEDIKNHPWLAPIDWMEVARRSGDGPIIPQVQGPSDTQNFKNADTADRLQLTQDVDIPPDVQQMFDSF